MISFINILQYFSWEETIFIKIFNSNSSSFRSNPFYEPKPTPNNLLSPVQELETERRVKRKAPAPPTISPKTGGVNENTGVSAGRDLSTSPKVGV